MLQDVTPNKHAITVYNELVKSLKKLQPRSRKVLLRKLNTTINRIVSKSGHAVQRVRDPPTT